MIALIEDTLFAIEPLVTTSSEPVIELGTDLKAKLKIGEKTVDYGVLWVCFNKCAHIDPKTGQITRKDTGLAHFRAIFGGKHLDFELNFT